MAGGWPIKEEEEEKEEEAVAKSSMGVKEEEEEEEEETMTEAGRALSNSVPPMKWGGGAVLEEEEALSETPISEVPRISPPSLRLLRWEIDSRGVAGEDADDAGVGGDGVMGVTGVRTSLKEVASFLRTASLKKPSLKMLAASTRVVVVDVEAEAGFKTALPGVTILNLLPSTTPLILDGNA